jgi:hypothetical protein
MSNETVTCDLGEFGYYEIKETAKLLTAWVDQGLPDDFHNDHVQVCMNNNSGFVFLTNADCQVAMMNGDNLESWYVCPECGHEGFLDDMPHEGNAECRRYLQEIGATEEEEEEKGGGDNTEEGNTEHGGRA